MPLVEMQNPCNAALPLSSWSILNQAEKNTIKAAGGTGVSRWSKLCCTCSIEAIASLKDAVYEVGIVLKANNQFQFLIKGCSTEQHLN